MRVLARIFIGSVFILLGLAGLVLPILQGWLFLGLGILLLAPDVPLFGRLVCWVEKRHPRFGRFFVQVRKLTGRMGKPVPPCPPKQD